MLLQIDQILIIIILVLYATDSAILSFVYEDALVSKMLQQEAHHEIRQRT